MASKRLDVFDINQNLWMEKSSMNEGRLGSALTAVGDKLYAVGGFISTLKPMRLEIYDISQNQLSIIESPPLNSILKPVATIEMYDISQNQWSIVERLSLDSIWKPTFPIGACAYLMGLGDSDVPPEIFESGWEDRFLAGACFIKMPKVSEAK